MLPKSRSLRQSRRSSKLLYGVADQVAGSLIHNLGMGESQAMAECIRTLDALKISAARGYIPLYPQQFSVGMCRRVMIAISLLCKPDLVIAEEPTTALGVSVPAQIRHLLAGLQCGFGMATILITDDLGVTAGLCHERIVLHGGQMMGQAPVDPQFCEPSDPHKRGQLRVQKGRPIAPRGEQAGDDRRRALPDPLSTDRSSHQRRDWLKHAGEEHPVHQARTTHLWTCRGSVPVTCSC